MIDDKRRRWLIIGCWSAAALAAMWACVPFSKAPPFPFILIGAAGAAYQLRRWTEGALVALFFTAMAAVIQLIRGVGFGPLMFITAIALPLNFIPSCLGGWAGAFLSKRTR